MIHGFMPGTRYHRKSLTYFGYSWRRLLVIFPLTDSMHEMQRNGAAARLPSFWRNWENVLAAVRIQRLRTRPKNCGKLSSVFVRALPEREGNVLVRRYFFVEPVADIAKRYGLTENNVMVILSRMRRKLKAHLLKEGYL